MLIDSPKKKGGGDPKLNAYWPGMLIGRFYCSFFFFEAPQSMRKMWVGHKPPNVVAYFSAARDPSMRVVSYLTVPNWVRMVLSASFSQSSISAPFKGWYRSIPKKYKRFNPL